MRASEVAKWQQRCRIKWDASDGRNGGAQRTVWEILLEMERFNNRAEEEYFGSSGLGPGLDQGFQACQSHCGVGVGDALHLLKEDPASAVRVV